MLLLFYSPPAPLQPRQSLDDGPCLMTHKACIMKVFIMLKMHSKGIDEILPHGQQRNVIKCVGGGLPCLVASSLHISPRQYNGNSIEVYEAFVLAPAFDWIAAQFLSVVVLYLISLEESSPRSWHQRCTLTLLMRFLLSARPAVSWPECPPERAL